MRKGWEERKLGEVYDVRDGTHDSPKYHKEGFPLITSKNLKNDSLTFKNIQYICEEDYIKINKRSKVDKGDVLFAMIGTIGSPVVIEEEPNFAIKNVALFKIPKNQSSYFLKYFFDSKKVMDKMINDAKGTTQKFVGLGYLRNFKILLPLLKEQQRIVAILDKAFAAIAKAKENAEKNFANARELFESYLHSVFVQTGEGWETESITKVCMLKSGTTLPPKVEKSDGDLPYLKVADMNLEKNKICILTSSRFVNKLDINKNGVIPVGSTIFPKRGGAIFTNKKRLTSVPICMDLNLMAVTPKKEILPEFIYYYFLGLDLREIGNGSSIPQINNYSIEPLKISFPRTISDQKCIIAKLDELSIQTKKLEAIYQQKLANLEELKKSILQKTFNGELTGA